MTIFDIEHSFQFNRHHSRFSRLHQNILMRLTEFQNRRKLRCDLAKLSENDLRDIGLTRHDVQASCNFLLSRDVVDEVRKIANTRVGNW